MTLQKTKLNAPSTPSEAIEKKRQERKRLTAEDFTPSFLVNDILDRLTKDSNETVWKSTKTIIDPACGNGNFLVEILKRKLDKGHTPQQALSTIFGVDIMADNIREARIRLLSIIKENYFTGDCFGFQKQNPQPITEEMIKIVFQNIVCAPLSKYPNGSLDYLSLPESETFNAKIPKETIDKWTRMANDDSLFDDYYLAQETTEIAEETVDTTH